MRKVAVFGSTGLVGSNLFHYFSNNGSVQGSCRHSDGADNRFLYGVKFDDLTNIDFSDFSEIYYTIHSPHFDELKIQEKFRYNYLLYHNFLNHLYYINFPGVVFYSSTEAVQRISDMNFGSHGFDYAYTHLMCERLSYFCKDKIKVYNYRHPNLFGYNHYKKRYEGVICDFIESSLKAEKIFLKSDGAALREFRMVDSDLALYDGCERIPDCNAYRSTRSKFSILEWSALVAKTVGEAKQRRVELNVMGQAVNCDKILCDSKIYDESSILSDIKLTVDHMMGDLQ